MLRPGLVMHRKGIWSLMTCAFFVCIMFPPWVHAESLTHVDWVNGYITVTGYGTAERGTSKILAVISSTEAAQFNAMRKLLESIEGVYIDSEILVRDFIVKESVTSVKVEGLLKGAQVIDTKTTWEEGLPVTAVTMRICMSTQGAGCEPENTLFDALPLDRFGDSSLIPQTEYSEAASLQTLSQIPPGEDDFSYKPSKPVTGVIFSLQGTPFRRVVLPVVVTIREDGKMSTVYSVKRVDPKIVRAYGIVRYADTLKQARKIEKLGSNVLVVPTEKVTDDNILVISAKSAQKIYETTMHGNDYLSKANVAISSE